jgi:hypothetical protein
MHPKEREIREAAAAAPFVPFSFVIASGDRYKVPSPDHISFFPDTDEDGVPVTEEERAQSFIVYGTGAKHRLLFSTVSLRSMSEDHPIPFTIIDESQHPLWVRVRDSPL